MSNKRGRRPNASVKGDMHPEIEEVAQVVPRVRFTVLCKEYMQLGGKCFTGLESLMEV